MPCTHPILAYVPESGHHEKPRFLCDYDSSEPDLFPPSYVEKGITWNFTRLPCRHCLSCGLKYARDWTTRLVLESMAWPSESNFFVTLTYDDLHVPRSENGCLTLRPSDLSSWIKRLRENVQRRYGHTGIRFYACGEYGDKTLRPHYHVCLFNAPVPAFPLSVHNSRGDVFYRVPDFELAWSEPRNGATPYDSIPPIGNVIVGRFSPLTAGYVARYVTKKLKKDYGRSDAYSQLGIAPVFSRCSRRPGIGSWYFDYDKTIYDHDRIVLPSMDGKTQIVMPPPYFDSKLRAQSEDFYQSIKSRRLDVAKSILDNVLLDMQVSEDEYFSFVDEKMKNISKFLPRKY